MEGSGGGWGGGLHGWMEGSLDYREKGYSGRRGGDSEHQDRTTNRHAENGNETSFKIHSTIPNFTSLIEPFPP